MDINKIRAALNTMQNGDKSLRNDLVKLPKGEHTIRFVPYKFNREMPFQELWFHYGINKQNFLCPKRMKGEDCPMCDFAGELWDKFKLTNDEDYKKAFKDLMPKQKIYAPVIVKKSSDETLVNVTTARFWGLATKTYEEVLQEIITADAEGIDVTDVDKGLDFNVRMDNFLDLKNRFAVKSIKTVRNPSPLVEGGKKAVDAVIDSCIDIYSIFEFKALTEMEEAVEKHYNPSTKTSSVDSVGTTKSYGSSRGQDDSDDADDRDIASEIDAKFDKLTGKA